MTWVIGSTGFVGSRLVPALRAAGVPALGISRTRGPEGAPGVDITDAAAVRRLFRERPAPETVVHVAGLAHRPRRSTPAEAYDRVNHRGAVRVLEAAAEAGVRRFLLFSSATVYGATGRAGPLAEDAPRRPVGPYASSKARAEDACLAADPARIACHILRFPALYAPDWLLNVRKRVYIPGTGGRLRLWIPGRQPLYSFCAIEHVIEAVLLGIRGRLEPGAYNVADGAPYSQREAAAAVARLDGARPGVPIPRLVARLPIALIAAAAGRRGALLREDYGKLFEGQVLDISKIRAAGLSPRIRLEELRLPEPAPRGAPAAAAGTAR